MGKRKELLSKPYLNIKEISIILGINQRKAKILFEKISQQEDEELKEYRIEKGKVKLTNVLKSQNYTFNSLLKTIEIEEQIKNS
mgnify:CR=1 FL=1